ncbi:MAG: PHP domain-containing protein, partial [Chloroflexi bacterium]|nr:PHP domain-containing protein [Chloroflexota bacterium]
DLHTHTTASDGTLTPTELVREAARHGLKILGITDHDTIAGLPEALREAEKWPLEVIPGVEINTDVPEGEIHVLGYWIRLEDQTFQDILERLRSGRQARAEQMVDKLNSLGYAITMDQVRAVAGDAAIGRPHVAQALQDAGHVATISEAFDRLIGRKGPAYAERMKFSPVEAVESIRAAGGAPVLAHPVIAGTAEAISRPLDLDTLLPQLRQAGLLGLECYYMGYPLRTTEMLLALARKHGLVATGGSDYHGPHRHRAYLGGVYVPAKCVSHLRQALAQAEARRPAEA